MRIQITLTVAEAKRIIAKGIAGLPAGVRSQDLGMTGMVTTNTLNQGCRRMLSGPE